MKLVEKLLEREGVTDNGMISPMFKLILQSSDIKFKHDDAVWRRVKLIPFENEFVDDISNLVKTLDPCCLLLSKNTKKYKGRN